MVYRQKETWQREATVAFSSGQISKGLKAYFDAGCIHFAENELVAQQQLIDDWQKLRESQLKDKNKKLSEYLIIAHRNSDVIALNHLAREVRIQHQEIAPGFLVKTQLGEISVSQGDRLLFLKNDRQLGVSNGRFATVLKIDFLESGYVRAITVELDGEIKSEAAKKIVTFDPQEYSDFTYGYAATVHKVQGMTVDHTFVLAGGHGWNKSLTYVAQSRHRESCHLYTDKTLHADFTQLAQHLNRLSIKDSVLDFPLAFAQRRNIEVPSVIETLQRREDAKVVAAYVDANREIGKCWVAYAEKITALGFKKTPYGHPVFEILKSTPEYLALQKAQVERDRLAATIASEPTRYTKALEIYALSLEKLHKESTNHQKRVLVERYLNTKQQGKVVIRDRVAATIAVDIKNYYPILKATDVSIRELRLHAENHTRRKLFASLNRQEREALKTNEKSLLRLATRYQKANRQVGHVWSIIFKAKESKIFITSKQLQQKQQTAFTLVAKRDYLAHRLLELSQKMEWPAIFEGIEIPKAITVLREQWKIDFSKLESQSAKHEQRLKSVQDWQALKINSQKMLVKLIQSNDQNKNKNQDQNNTATIARYYDWLAANEEIEVALKTITKQINGYQYALHCNNLSVKECMNYETVMTNIKQAIAHLATLGEVQCKQTAILSTFSNEQRQKIHRAQQIERGTQIIKGTLAERYLREHRGIQGRLPNTYRYHPGLYCVEAKRQLPALVVMARNQKQQTQAVQVIFLNPQTANKAKLNNAKLTYGVLSQNQVGVLVNRGLNQNTIAVAEGPETALSIAVANPDITIYATLGSSNFARIPYSAETQKILFCADNDGAESASQKKLLKAAEHLTKQGLDVWQVMPEQEKQDFNDVLKSEGIAAIQRQLEQAVLLKKAQTLQAAHEEIKQAATQLVDKASLEHVQDEYKEDQKAFHHLLENYLDHELELTQLVTKMHAVRFQDKAAAKAYSQQAHILQNTVQQLVEKIIQSPTIKNLKNEISTLPEQREINLVKLGGFASVKERLLNKELTVHDLVVLTKHLYSKIQRISQSLQQTHDRGRYSY